MLKRPSLTPGVSARRFGIGLRGAVAVVAVARFELASCFGCAYSLRSCDDLRALLRGRQRDVEGIVHELLSGRPGTIERKDLLDHRERVAVHDRDAQVSLDV